MPFPDVVTLRPLILKAVLNLYSAPMAMLLLTNMKPLSRKGIDLRSAFAALQLLSAPSLLYLLRRPL